MAALRVCEAFVNSPSSDSQLAVKPFVYISAEDIFRPVVPARYIESKREAEAGIEGLVAQQSTAFRGVYIRPSTVFTTHPVHNFLTIYDIGLVYHAHFRPLSTPLAALLEFSAQMHAKVPKAIPTPSSILRRLGLESVPNALTIPPIHVDHVGEAICAALENETVKGVVGVREMRELIGWAEMGHYVVAH